MVVPATKYSPNPTMPCDVTARLEALKAWLCKAKWVCLSPMQSCMAPAGCKGGGGGVEDYIYGHISGLTTMYCSV